MKAQAEHLLSKENEQMGRRKNGLGTFTILPDGRYRMRLRMGFNNAGGARILTVTGTSETDCLKKMKKKAAEYENSPSTAGTSLIKKITVTELCNIHLNEHLSQKDRLKPKAADRRESTIKNQIEPYKIGRLQTSSVTSQDVSEHIETLLQEGKLSVSSVEKTFDVINAAFKWAENQYYIDYNPCSPVRDRIKNRLKNLKKRNSSEGIVVVLSDDQKEMLEKYVEEMDGTPVHRHLLGLSALLLMYTGIRVGELCALRWSDWSREGSTLNIGKTRNIVKDRTDSDSKYIANENSVKNYHSRTLALSAKAVKVLEKMYLINPKHGEDDYILINRRGTPSNPSNYDANINKLYKEIGMPESISGAHIFRRTKATALHSAGVSVENIASYLGDTQETVLKHYISLTKKVVAGGKVLNVVEIPVDVD